MTSRLAPLETSASKDASPTEDGPPARAGLLDSRSAATVALAIVVGLVLIHTLAMRYSINPDGISYLDLSDLVRRQGIGALVHGYWSPAYPTLLAVVLGILDPSLPREIEVVHWLEALLCFVALAAYWFFVTGVRARLSLDDDRSLASARWFSAFALALFLWGALVQIDLMLVTPDMLVATWVFVIAGISVRSAPDRPELGAHALLGIVVGLAYLTKAALLPFGLPFLAAAALSARRGTHKLQRGVVGGAAFAIVAAPFIVSLSVEKGRPTFGDVGPIAYAWMVNDVPYVAHWQGGPAGTGVPVHPTRQLSTKPNAYEFASPVAGSYPVWFDASYWYDGVRPRMSVRRMARIGWEFAFAYASWLAPLIVATLTMAVLRGVSGTWQDLRRSWPLWAPALLPLIGYGVVYSEPRYVAPFIAVLAISGVGALRVSEESYAPGLRNALLLALAVVFMIPVINLTARRSPGAMRALTAERGLHHHAAVADALGDAGAPKGAKIVLVGTGVDAYWARQAESRIIGEIPDSEAPYFWSATPARRDSILALFDRFGADAAVAITIPDWADTSGWEPAGATGVLYRLLPVRSDSVAIGR